MAGKMRVPKARAPMAGSQVPLTAMIRNGKLRVDDRMAPTGSNYINDDGDGDNDLGC